MTKERASELIDLMRWKNLGCLNLQPRPKVEEMTEAERRELWDMSGAGWWTESLALSCAAQGIDPRGPK